MPDPIDKAIAALAARQHGNVTRRQLLDLGLGDSGISHRATVGRLHRVFSGVYAVGGAPLTPVDRAAAAVLACGRGAVLSHSSAAALWGIVMRWAVPFEVTVSEKRHPRGIRVHRCAVLSRSDIRNHLGIWVTSPARTLLDVAPGLSDRRLSRAVNDLRLAGFLQPAAIEDLLARVRKHPGTARLRALIAHQGGPTRSVLEDAFLKFIRRYGLPEPVINATVAGYEVDALFEAERLIVELDGYESHRDRQRFESDRDRDADTLQAGHATVRITWYRLIGAPASEARRLKYILAQRRGGSYGGSGRGENSDNE